MSEGDLISNVDQWCEEYKHVARLYAAFYHALINHDVPEETAKAVVCTYIAAKSGIK